MARELAVPRSTRDDLLPRAAHVPAISRKDPVPYQKRTIESQVYTSKPPSSDSRPLNLRPGANAPMVEANKAESRRYAPVMGIDLGTTNSCVAAWDGTSATVLRSFRHGTTLIPSVVSFIGESYDQVVVGTPALDKWVSNPLNTFTSSKRWLGRKFDEKAQNDAQMYPYELTEDENGYCAFKIHGTDRVVTCVQIASFILEYLKVMANEEYFRCDVRDAVIAVPAYFDDNKRALTKKAGELAGLRVLTVLNEPTAAALATGFSNVRPDEHLWLQKNMLVFDLGGGTCDVTLMRLDHKKFEVLATDGDPCLGGNDFDECLYNHFLLDFTERNPSLPIDSNTGKVKLSGAEQVQLREKCRMAKEAMSGSRVQEFEITLCGVTYEAHVSEITLQKLTRHLVDKALGLITQVLKNSGFQRADIDDVVLVGGSTKMPFIQRKIKEYFRACKAYVMTAETDPSRMQDPNHISIDPDELVAKGAVIKAAVLLGDTGTVKPPVLPLITDVVPQTVGLALKNGDYFIAIPRNTPIEATHKLQRCFTFFTGEDDQTAMELCLLQGQNPVASKNYYLGTCKLDGLPKRPKGEVEVCVSFCYDQKGMLEVMGWVNGQSNISQKLAVTDHVYHQVMTQTYAPDAHSLPVVKNTSMKLLDNPPVTPLESLLREEGKSRSKVEADFMKEITKKREEFKRQRESINSQSQSLKSSCHLPAVPESQSPTRLGGGAAGMTSILPKR